MAVRLRCALRVTDHAHVQVLAVGWSASRVMRFVSASLADRSCPPAPHAVSFATWVARHRAAFGAVVSLGCVQLGALDLFRSRAFAGNAWHRRALRPPITPRVWAALHLHAASGAFLRNAATVASLARADGHLVDAVEFLKLLAAVAVCANIAGVVVLAALTRLRRAVATGADATARVPLVGGPARARYDAMSVEQQVGRRGARGGGGGGGGRGDDDLGQRCCVRDCRDSRAVRHWWMPTSSRWMMLPSDSYGCDLCRRFARVERP